ncbi:MAG TPA: universal stress protein [Thermoleophilia bacterium]|jgi:nucleotide-binding universal stress UspA family protein
MIPQRILVATDGSPAAKAAEALAADLAGLMSQSRGVEVVVATVVRNVGDVMGGGSITKPTDMEEAGRISQAGAGHIRDLLSEAPPRASVKVEAKVLNAPDPGEGIVIEAHAAGTCSIIVMGTRTRRGVKEAVLGSVSQHVVREAHCPVMIARE